jgi:anti-sigma B factor antagonist
MCDIGLLTLTADMQSDPLTIEAREGKSPDTRILKIIGPLTLNNVFPFQADLRKETSPLTILDMTEVPYMDSAGMGAVLNFYVACQKSQRRMVLTGVSERVYALLELTNTTRLLTIVPTLAEAE